MADDSRNGGGIGRRQCRTPRFSIRLLERKDNHGANASRHDNNQLLSLLPASYRTESDNLAAPAHHVTACLEKELDLRRLTSIHGGL
ncbi:hypothetical protein EDB80DRAFT_875050 [Ilyonectria destructans]|nr:hypothetical protein EDB80DRAFT_875050 [Ilyonectria destructans]